MLSVRTCMCISFPSMDTNDFECVLGGVSGRAFVARAADAPSVEGEGFTGENGVGEIEINDGERKIM